VIRELAENPNVYQPLGPGRALHRDPDGRFAIFLAPGTSVHSATVQRVRLGTDSVASAVEEIRGLLRSLSREGAEWELGESSEPSDLVERLLAVGLRRDESEPVAIGMVLREASLAMPEGVVARAVASVEELRAAREVQRAAFGDPRPVDSEQAARDYRLEGVDGSTFVAFVDGELVAAAYASYTPWGLILFGGATLPSARGRGAYRALVAARAVEGARRGTPALVTHAGKMSRPTLERLGFVPVARIDRLLDVF
jgi:GNAT superfamily N-acetyltransferase